MEKDTDLNNSEAPGAEETVPESLQKFKNEDGTLDVAKLSQGYMESEKMAHEANQKRAEADRALQLAQAGPVTDPYGVGREAPGAGRSQASDTDDAEYQDDTTEKVSEREYVRAEDAQPVIQALIETTHPEVVFDPAKGQFANPEFIAGLKGFVATLPLATKQSIARGEFASTEWAIRHYKKLRGGEQETASQTHTNFAGGQEKPNFTEGSSSTAQSGDQVMWSRAKIKKLYTQNRAEYARREAEISKAYKEGRVTD